MADRRTDIDRGIKKLRRRIEELKGLNASEVRWDDSSVKQVASDIDATLSAVFGEDSQEHEKNRLLLSPPSLLNTSNDAERQETFPGRIGHTIKRLEELIESLEEKREEPEAEQPGTPPLAKSTPNSHRVFVVHGRDVAAKEQVRTFLSKLALEPVILSEQPNQGQTVIEKFEGNADVDFVVVLFTPDDTGNLANSSSEPRPRVRQNVIFELGFFVGKLGRKKVCVLHKGSIEIMSDYHGIAYVEMDNAEGWQLKLAKEIRSTGINVDLNRLSQ